LQGKIAHFFQESRVIMKKTTLLIAALFGSVMAAQAQYSQNLTLSNLNIRIGGAYPMEDRTRDFTGNQFAIGFDFRNSYSLIKGSQGYFSFDWYAGSSSGKKGKIFPILWNQKFTLSQKEGFAPYYFAGVGMASVDFTSQKWVFAYRGGVGVDLGERIFTELTYLGSEAQGGVRVNSLGLFVGYKF
jgi:hypothetical protein